ncbi:MAG: glycosyltransferase family 2 protein [Candidatus Bathyarchaeia archaeon]|nr:glycosyltransferase family 2 protein [Candidatus Bathyarchaeia archaeon]
MESIDVVMLTKNSEHLLNKCLKSIYRNVPVKRLIIVDGFSTDNTLKIMNEFNKKYGNVKIISEKGSRGKARERGIQEVETELFMFVDSDVILCKDWFKKASRYIQEDVGAIWGVDIPGDVKSKFMTKILQRMEARAFDIRGGCHDILIRYDVVKDIKIPSELHVLEDAYIKEWITAKNYKVIVSYASYCKHYKTMKSLLSKENMFSTIFELKNIRLVKERLVYAAIFALIWLLHEAGIKNEKGHLA